MSFAEHVSEETVIRAGFNYWEPSYLVPVEGRYCRAYHAELPRGDCMVILESPSMEFYLKVFAKGELAMDDFLAMLRPSFRIPPGDLEKVVLSYL